MFRIMDHTEKYIISKKLSSETIKTVRKQGRMMDQYFNDRSIADPAPIHLIEYADYYYHTKNYTLKSVFSLLGPLRPVFRYLDKVGIYNNIIEPACNKYYSSRNISIPIPSDNDVRRVIIFLNKAELPIEIRNSLIMMLCLSGLRLQEISLLQIKNIYNHRPVEHIYTYKREYAVATCIVNRLQDYISKMGITDYIFYDLNHKNRSAHLDKGSINNIVKKLLLQIGIYKRGMNTDSLRIWGERNRVVDISL